MRNGRVLRGALALALVTSFVAGCGDDDDEPEATGVDTTEEVQEISITAADYEYTDAPEEISAGLVEIDFENTGKAPHEVAFIEIGDTPLDEFIPKFTPVVDESGPFPEEAVNISGSVEVPGGETQRLTFTVAEGTYALICLLTGTSEDPASEEGEAHYKRGMAQTIEIGPAEGATELPEADGTITAVDYTFEQDIEAGDTTINFLNEGPDEVHFAAIQAFPEGTTAEQAKEAFGTLILSEGPPAEGAILPEDVEGGFSGVFSSGLGSQIEIPGGFESGRTYLLACFIQDRAGGPPHAIGHDMYTTFTVE